MKLLTKNADYAVRALLVMGMSGEGYISARDIAKAQKMPYQYVRKILQSLISKGFAVSREGGRGGFKLKVSPDNIRVADVIELFQGEIKLSECMFRNKICQNRSTCVLRKNIERIEELVVKEFSDITIGKLLREMK